jgi:hypothetical protein
MANQDLQVTLEGTLCAWTANEYTLSNPSPGQQASGISRRLYIVGQEGEAPTEVAVSQRDALLHTQAVEAGIGAQLELVCAVRAQAAGQGARMSLNARSVKVLAPAGQRRKLAATS